MTQASEYQAAMERAQAGLCSHGGHGWDGDTCSEIPELPAAFHHTHVRRGAARLHGWDIAAQECIDLGPVPND